MTTYELIMVLFKVLGGLALFIYGMHVMTGALRETAGSSLRTILAKATKSPVHGFAFGTLTGFLAHSAAAITMLAGFINAGVMTLTQSIAPVFGANFGTSLSMQLISFDISAYCWAAIGIGFLVEALLPHPRYRKIGAALIGFGLLFLGMETISAAIKPHRELVAPLIAHINGATFLGRVSGIAISAVLTALITSSGAMIGLCFALIHAGAITSFDQIAPIVLGAHIGTCIVPIVASVSMSISARRSAIAHLVFNIANVILAVAIWPFLDRLTIWAASVPVQKTAADLVAQAANLHTLVMFLASVLFLPFVPLFTRLVVAVTPSSQPPPEPSHLDPKLIPTPERAIAAAIRELHRMALVCVDCMLLTGKTILRPDNKLLARIASSEDVINQVHLSMKDYLRSLSRRNLSDRQAIFVQNLHRCMKDIERIGDHISHIATTSAERFAIPNALLPAPLFDSFFHLFVAAKRVIVLLAKSFDPENPSFQKTALEILKARDVYQIMSMDMKADLVGAASSRSITPIAGYYISRCIENLDRLVRRAKSIAFAERQPTFFINEKKWDKDAAPSASAASESSAAVAPAPYLQLLESEDPDAEDPVDADLPDTSSALPTTAPFTPPAK